ncbi:3-deoxy-D-manno-octulosonic acid transferase [soil metagenome]
MLFNFLYLFVLALLSPWLLWRSLRTGRYRQGLAAKLRGRVNVSPDARTTVWFHGVSVGEVHLLVTLVKAYRQQHLDHRIVISTTTETGLTEAKAKFADCTVIAWPFDFTWAVANALDAVQPSLIVLAEAEMWPNFLKAAAKRNVPVVVINARLSPRSFKRYQWVVGLARKYLFNRVEMIAVQSQDYADRFAALGLPTSKLRVTGSIKYDGATANGVPPSWLSRDAKSSERSGLTLVAGSTHSPEEEIVLAAFSQLRQRHTHLQLVLVPRHPDRFEEVARIVERCGIPFVRRSQITEPLREFVPIILLDTVGELGAAWSIADLGYVGGSLDGHRGGQSMIEPAGYGVPTVFGPHVWNFRDASRRLLDAVGAIQIRSADELAGALESFIIDEAKRKAMGHAAKKLVQEQQGATQRTVELLGTLLQSQSRQAA